MSFCLPNKGAMSASRSRTQAPDGSKSFLALVITVIPGKPSKNDPEISAPPTLTFVTCEDVIIDYVFREPRIPKGSSRSRNIIAKPLSPEQAPSLEIKAGYQTNLISVFNPPDLVTNGKLCRFEGVYLDAFQSENDAQPLLKLTCTHISANTDINIDDFLNKIPYSNKCIHPSRDIKSGDTMSYLGGDENKLQPYYFIAVNLTGEMNSEECEEVTGTFVELAQGVKSELTYAPYNVKTKKNGPAEIALTGGRIDDKPQKAQFYVRQKDREGIVTGYRCFTRVFANTGLNALQMDWSSIGDVIIPHIRGKTIFTIDRKATAHWEVDPDPSVVGDLVVNMILYPSVGDIAKSMGIKITWDVACKIDDRLTTPKSMTVKEKLPPLNLLSVSGLNILRYNGDVSCIPKAMEQGWIELYMICNMQMGNERREELRNMQPIEMWNDLSSTYKKFFTHLTPYYAIFAVTTPECPCKIHELVTSIGGTPPGQLLLEKTNKKLRITKQEGSGDKEKKGEEDEEEEED